jgi:hypothetical protein
MLLGRAAIFGYKEDNNLEDGPLAGRPLVMVGAAVRSRRVSVDGKGVE